MTDDKKTLSTARNCYKTYDKEKGIYFCVYGKDIACDDKVADCRTCNLPIAEEMREVRFAIIEAHAR